MNTESDKHWHVCQKIEVGLKCEYDKNNLLTDTKTIYALENGIIAVKQEFGYAKNEKFITDIDTAGIIDWCIKIGKERIGKVDNLTLKEYITRIEKIKRSVKRHSEYGRRGYYEFIKDYV